MPASVTVVDDRPDPRPDELLDLAHRLAGGRSGSHRVLTTGGRGPAAARNAGWRAGRAPWVVFLDDDVRLRPGWGAALAQDLAAADRGGVVGAVRGRLRVPLPADRPPTDWERQVGGLSEAPGWLTADLAVRRSVLEQVGGLDERFPRAYREDTDLELRARAAGWTGTVGRRAVNHPVAPADRWTSVRRQRGNADDVLLARLHGRDWRDRVGEAPGAFRGHAVTTAAGGVAVAALAARRPRVAATAATAWAALTARFAWRRIAPGPRDRSEVVTMLATSVAIPPAAVYHRLAGHWRWRDVTARRARRGA
jgi:GT2 family glycosyltransferase